MRLVRLAMCVAAFAVVGKIAFSEDIDVQSLQAKLAAQEARLNDLQAKMNSGAYAAGGEVEGLLSANKNAVVTIGGTVNTRYFYRNGKVEDGGMTRTLAAGGAVAGTIADGENAYFGADGVYLGTGAVPNAAWAGAVETVVNNNTGGNVVAPNWAAGTYNVGTIWDYRTNNGVGMSQYNTGAGIAGYADAANWSPTYAGRNGYYRRDKASQGDLKMADAKLTVHIDVNEYFDAFLKIDLQSSNNTNGYGYANSDNAEQYWVRWKNVCNSGFGLKVGRDVLTFGEGGYGALGSYAAGGGDGLAAIFWDQYSSELANPLHNNWDEGRYMQITPYWESKDGKFSAELSLYQDYAEHGQADSDRRDSIYYDNKYKSRNYGMGSASLRLRFRPIEGLLLSASAANFHDRSGDSHNKYWTGATAKNNTFVDFAFNYRPCFFNRMMLWGQYIHGWNVDNIDDLDSDALNLGVMFDINESWSVFVQGDYMKSKGYGKAFNNVFLDNNGALQFANLGYGSGYDKATAWSAYAGLQYKLPYGVMLEGGWKYEEIKWKNNVINKSADHKVKTAKLKGHTVYAHLGFDF